MNRSAREPWPRSFVEFDFGVSVNQNLNFCMTAHLVVASFVLDAYCCFAVGGIGLRREGADRDDVQIQLGRGRVGVESGDAHPRLRFAAPAAYGGLVYGWLCRD